MKWINFKAYGENEPFIRYGGIIVLTIILPLVIDFTHSADLSYLQRIPLVFLYTSLYWNATLMVFSIGRYKFPDIKNTHKRLSVSILFTVLVVFLIDVSVFYGFQRLHLVGLFQKADLWEVISITEFAITIFIGSIYEGVYFYQQWKHTYIEAERLRSQNLQSQLDVLKTQLSPHFLFNTLNALLDLIHENPKKAEEFTEHLAGVYRYILQTNKLQWVTLEEEMEFVESYLFLHQIRLSGSFSCELVIESSLQEYVIPPLSVQMLVENVLKHNSMTEQKPLKMYIRISEKTLEVENPIRPKRHQEESIGIGLKNIQKRFELLGMDSLIVEQTEECFRVCLPLMKKEDFLRDLHKNGL